MTWEHDFPTLLTLIEPAGVLHLGGNEGQELPLYRRHHLSPIVMVEPIPTLAAQLRRHPDITVVEAAVTPTAGTVTLHVTEYQQASSVLRPLEHPVARLITVPAVRLADLPLDGINILIADIQGAELAALQSGPLDQFDLIIVEASPQVRYQGGTDRQTLTEYLNSRGFQLHTDWQHTPHPIWDLAFLR